MEENDRAEPIKGPISEPVAERLLLSKDLLGPFRFAVVAQPDRRTLARHILTAHDAAELALSGIALHLHAFPTGSQVYLMDFFSAIKEGKHPDREVDGKEYFNQLNRARINTKHHGIYPDFHQWWRVAEKTYDYISEWCKTYIGIGLDELDDAVLILDEEVKKLFHSAKDFFDKGLFKKTKRHLRMPSY